MPQVAGAAVLKFFVQVAINVGIQQYNKKRAKAMARRAARVLQKVDVAYAGGLEPRRKLYGYFRASGLETIPAITTGLTGTRLHKVLTLSDGEIESIDAVWFNNDRIPNTDYGDGAGGGGAINAGTYDGHGQVFPHLGTNPQSADSALVSVPGWSTEHRGDGVAYCYVFWDANNEVYKAGAPTFLVEGQGALVYDPRMDTSPGAHPSTSTYFTFTTNAALITTDFLRWGGGEDPANINWSDVVTAADHCDESVTVPNGAGGTTTQPRFTCSIEVYAPQTLADRDETISMLARAMMGRCWYSGGKWRLRAGVYTTAVGTILDDDFLSDVRIATAQPRSSGASFNTVRGSYVEQGENTQPKPIPEVSTAAYVTEDDEVVYTDAAFPTARSVYEAERNAILLLRQSRRRIIISAVFKFKCTKFEVYDVVNVTCAKVGWSAQTARILSMQIRQNFTVQIELQEIASSDFTNPSTGDYLTPNTIAVPESTSYAPNAPRNLAASSQANGIIFTWDPPLNAPVGVLYRLYEYTSSTPFSSATQIGPDTAQNSMVVPKTDTTVRYFWVVAVDPITASVSAQAPPSNGVPGNAQTASSVLAAIVYPGTAEASVYTTTATTNTVSVTPSGGTAPYTYSTTFTSGGTNITINNGTTASPSFSATTALSEGETRTGTARIRVTDNVADTYDVYIAVTITRNYSVLVNDTTSTATGSAAGPGSGGTPAVISYVVSSSGDITVSPSPGSPTTYQWKNPSATASDYEVRFTLNSGTLQSGTTGSWLNLGTTRQVIGSRTPGAGPGTSTQNLTVEIRLATGGAALDSGTLIMNETIV